MIGSVCRVVPRENCRRNKRALQRDIKETASLPGSDAGGFFFDFNPARNCYTHTIRPVPARRPGPRLAAGVNRVWLADICDKKNEWMVLEKLEEDYLPDMWRMHINNYLYFLLNIMKYFDNDHKS